MTLIVAETKNAQVNEGDGMHELDTSSRHETAETWSRGGDANRGDSTGDVTATAGAGPARIRTIQNRFEFPHPSEKEIGVMWRIIHLMRDGKRRSKLEICLALGLPESTEIGARIRDAKRARFGAWPFEGRCPLEDMQFTDSRDEGPDDDGIYRWTLKQRPPKPEVV